MRKSKLTVVEAYPSEHLELVNGMFVDTAKLSNAEYRDALSIGIIEMLKLGRIRWPEIKVS